MEWMDELEKAVRRAPEMDEDGDGENDEQEMGETSPPACPPMKKSAGKYAPADNGDDDNSEGSETNADEIDDANNDTAKKQNLYPKNKGGVKKSLGGDVADAIDASEVLESLVKSIDNLAAAKDVEVAALRSEVAGLAKGLQSIGKAMVKSLSETQGIAKSLTAQVEEIGRQPQVRKSQVRKVEKSFAGAGSEQPSFPSKEQRMQKSMAAIKAGTISPVEVSLFEGACNRGEFRQDLWRKMGGE